MAIVLVEDFEGFAIGTQAPNLRGKMDVVEYGRAGNLEVSNQWARTGTRSVKVHQKQSDPEAEWGNKRTEWSWNKVNNPEREWYAVSYFFPATYGSDPTEEIILQFHDESESGSGSASPCIAIEIIRDELRLAVRYSTANYILNRSSIKTAYYPLGKLPKAGPMDLVVNSNFSPDPLKGFCNVYINGKMAIGYKGACGYIGSRFPYAKYGLYKWMWMPGKVGSNQTERLFYVDNVRFGDRNCRIEDFLVKGVEEPAPNKAPILALVDRTTDLTEITLISNATDPDGKILKLSVGEEGRTCSHHHESHI